MIGTGIATAVALALSPVSSAGDTGQLSQAGGQFPPDGGSDVNWAKVAHFFEHPIDMEYDPLCAVPGGAQRLLQIGYWAIIRDLTVQRVDIGHCYITTVDCELAAGTYLGEADILSINKKWHGKVVAHGEVSLPYPHSRPLYNGGPFLVILTNVANDETTVEIASLCKVGA